MPQPGRRVSPSPLAAGSGPGSRRTDTMAFTRCTPAGGEPVGKRIHHDDGGYRVSGQPRVARWKQWEQEEWADVDECVTRLKAIGADRCQILIPGALKEGLDPEASHLRRKLGPL